MKYDSEKVKTKLQERLKRQPEEKEISNAQNDPIIASEILLETITNLESRMAKLEKQVWP